MNFKSPKIVQIYPFSNPVSSQNSRAVVMAGMPYVDFSKFCNEIIVLSRSTDKPYGKNVYCLNVKNKKEYRNAIISYLKNLPNPPVIIEVQQDFFLASKLARIFAKTTKVSLLRHTRYLFKFFWEKHKWYRYLFIYPKLNRLSFVFTISNYTNNLLVKAYPKAKHKFITLYNSYGHLNKDLVDIDILRLNQVIFAGKCEQAKGFNAFFSGLKTFLENHQLWSGLIIGAVFSGKPKYSKGIDDTYNDVLNSSFKTCIKVLKKLPVDQVFLNMKQSKILVIPSIVKEAFGLVALEGLLAGCIVISSKNGALPEVCADYAYYLNEVTPEEINRVLTYVANNLPEAEQKAAEGKQWALENYNPLKLVTTIDKIREKIINANA